MATKRRENIGVVAAHKLSRPRTPAQKGFQKFTVRFVNSFVGFDKKKRR